MKKIAHFFDFDVIVDINSSCWIIDKNNPNAPIMKIPKSDFNLIKSGIYRSQNNKVEFNGKTFWLPTNLVNELKVKVKVSEIDFSNLAISLQEFINKDIINNLNFDLNINLLKKAKKNEDTYIICSKQTKNTHEVVINKIKEKMKLEDLELKNFYFINETFYNQKDDEINHKKLRLFLQHLVGYKTDNDRFIDKEITRYDIIEYYDNNYDTIKITSEINLFLDLIYKNTEDGIKSVIKEDIMHYKPQFIVNQITENQLNKIITKKIDLNISNIIKTFEGFKVISK